MQDNHRSRQGDQRITSEILARLPSALSLTRREDAVLVYVNPHFEKLFGYEAGELLGKHVGMLRAPASGPEDTTIDEVIAELQAKGAWSGQFHNRRKNGSSFFSHATVVAFTDSTHGQVWLSVHEDITDRRRTRDALRESEARLKAIADHTPAAIYVKDLRGRYLLVNREFRDIFHLTEDEILGYTDHEIFSAATADAFRANDLLVAAARGPISFDELVPLDDGKHTYLSVKFPLLRDNGHIYATCGISTDITERKRMEEALVEAKQVLEDRVTQRTEELAAANRKLLREIEERRHIEERQTLLLAELDHRVKNALATIVALTDQTAERAPSVESFSTALTGRIRAMARSHEALAHRHWEGIELQQVVRDVTTPFSAQAESRLVATGDPVFVSRDAALPLCLALHELATNALKHGALSTLDGHVDLRWQIGADSGLTLTWKERGLPIDHEPGPRGTGLELMHELIVEQLHGALALDFTSNGLDAVLEIPSNYISPSSGRTVAPEPPPDPALERASLEGLVVLLVEDDRLQARMLSRVLEREGCQVQGPAGTIDRALELLRDQTPDIALLDVNVEGENSAPVAEMLKASGRPYVVITGYANSSALPPVLRAAPRLEKPIDPIELAATLRTLVR